MRVNSRKAVLPSVGLIFMISSWHIPVLTRCLRLSLQSSKPILEFLFVVEDIVLEQKFRIRALVWDDRATGAFDVVVNFRYRSVFGIPVMSDDAEGVWKSFENFFMFDIGRFMYANFRKFALLYPLPILAVVEPTSHLLL